MLLVTFTDGHAEVFRVTREREAASREDVEFIGHARRDVLRLLAALDGESRLSRKDVDDIEDRYSRASAAPWQVFLESDGGIGGCSVIVISDDDDQPDLYLWRPGDQWRDIDIAPDSDFEFVAAARLDIPKLVAALRSEASL